MHFSCCFIVTLARLSIMAILETTKLMTERISSYLKLDQNASKSLAETIDLRLEFELDQEHIQPSK